MNERGGLRGRAQSERVRSESVVEWAFSFRRTAVLGIALAAIALNGLASPAAAEVTREDIRCITTFNKSLRKVAKTHGKIVKKCLSDFARGNLVAQTPEQCIASDPNGKINGEKGEIAKAVAKINKKCPEGLPALGVSEVNAALVRGILNQFNILHGSIGPDLDDNLISVAADANCQYKVGTALLACSDTRLKEYLKCQKKGLKSGQIIDASSMAAECLGTLGGSQPDDSGRIERACVTKVDRAVSQQCADIDLQTAFASCNTPLAATLTSCLDRRSACEVCETLNEADGLMRDCDSMDDGIDNGSCNAECGDGVIHEDEGCDDENGASGDGCSDFCQIEGGWTCTGEPSVCSENCGDGSIDLGEDCDDGDMDNGDGCSATCFVENGFTCAGEPSVCVPHCGDGIVDPGEGEVCDDGDMDNGDGCSSTCTVEGGWNCAGEPSVCTFDCGNGTFEAGETCDDGDATGGDGCSAICKIETGWLCSGQPSLCSPICGDGLKRGTEACDDGDATNGDGCSLSCQVELGYSCSAGQPSVCSAVCGDGLIRGLETCDDNNTTFGDGCTGDLCRQEFTHACGGQPSVCVALCGDGNLDGVEECDDGGTTSGDGCNAACKIEPGYACSGTLCFPTCGNGLLNLGEQCDDGNLVTGDGCTSGCKNERGYLCTVPGSPCENFAIFVDSPSHGTFTTGSTAVISGHYTTLPSGTAEVRVNGVLASTFNPVARTFSHTVSLSSAAVFNPVLVTLKNTTNNDQVRDRIVIIRGNSVLDGAFSPMSIALRLNDSGLDAVEPLVTELAGSGFDIGALLPPGSVVTDSCFINSPFGCLGSARVTIASPAPSTSGFGLAIDSKVGYVFGDIDIFDIVINVNIQGSGLVPNCGLRMTASSLELTGNYTLEPVSGGSGIDVNLDGDIGSNFSGFNTTFTSGLCSAPIIGDIIQALLPDVEQLALDGIQGFIGDPDGAGPLDSPIADGIETALDGIDITGPAGEGLGLMLDAPLFQVAEDNAGITLGSDSRFTVVNGTGPGECVPPAGAPNFTRSYSKNDPFPSFGANTPVGNNPYGLGICISAAGFNQLMRGQVECGLMITELTEIDLDGSGPLEPIDLDSTTLSALIPEFGALPPGTPLEIRIRPTLAPIVTGNAGPGGELTELKLSHLLLEIVDPGPDTLLLSGAIDAPLGMNLAFLPDGSGLEITVNPPASPTGITVAILDNPLGVNVVALEALLPTLIQGLIPDLAGALSGFPLPQFFGLNLSGVEVSRNGQFLSLFANLTQAP